MSVSRVLFYGGPAHLRALVCSPFYATIATPDDFGLWRTGAVSAYFDDSHGPRYIPTRIRETETVFDPPRIGAPTLIYKRANVMVYKAHQHENLEPNPKTLARCVDEWEKLNHEPLWTRHTDSALQGWDTNVD